MRKKNDWKNTARANQTMSGANRSWPQLMTKEQIDECAKKMINKAGASLVSAKGQDNLQLYYGYGEN